MQPQVMQQNPDMETMQRQQMIARLLQERAMQGQQPQQNGPQASPMNPMQQVGNTAMGIGAMEQQKRLAQQMQQMKMQQAPAQQMPPMQPMGM